MGAGKTLASTQLGFKNWFSRKMKIYSNYHLYKLPYYYLETIKQIDYCKDGVVLLDEFWRLCDSRLSRKTSNKIVTDVLARSRKRHLVYIFTAQVIDMIDKRIRKTTDFVSYPMLFRGESTCKCLIFRTGYPRNANYMKTFYFNTAIPFSIFNSNEEVDMVDDTDSEDPIPEPKLIWQEGAAKCRKCGFVITMMEVKCPECDSSDFTVIEPIYFNTWEEADKQAEQYWEKKIANEQIEDIEE